MIGVDTIKVGIILHIIRYYSIFEQTLMGIKSNYYQTPGNVVHNRIAAKYRQTASEYGPHFSFRCYENAAKIVWKYQVVVSATLNKLMGTR